ncbi:octopamine receptor beta-2R-like [Oculina patagonica]
MSLLGKYPCDNITAPTYLSFSSASFTILSAVVATVGNFLVVLAVFLDPNRELRSPFSYFVANLALADVIVGLLTSPLAAIYVISEGLKHPNQQFRVWMHMTYFISCTASLLSLTALALDRYVAITYPLLYRIKLSPSRAFLVSLLVWIVSILLSLIYFIVGYNKFRFVFANTAVAVTFAVMIFTNVKIFKYLRCQVHQWDALHDSTDENLAMKRAVKMEKKITKTLLIVLALFLACYVPACICIYIVNLCSTCNCVFIHWVRDIQFVIVMINSSVNPFVYPWRLQGFRKAFKSILTFRACVRRLRSVSVNLQLSAFSISNPGSYTSTVGQINPIEIKD